MGKRSNSSDCSMIPWLKNHPSKRCTAVNRRTGLRCKNPKAFGCKTCRYHGARKIHTNVNAPNYIHGENTKEALIERRIGLRVLYRLYLLGLKHGMFTKGSRLRGRPPNIKKP